MRCPNCGNENPDDYVFCDECGARIQPQEAEVGAGEAVSANEPVYASVGGDGGSGPQGAQPALDASAGTTGGGVCPNCGAATVPGEAYCNECGAELATAGAAGEADMDAAGAGMSPYGEAGGSDMASAPLESAPEMSYDGSGASEAPPVTEDTMPPSAESDTAAGMTGATMGAGLGAADGMPVTASAGAAGQTAGDGGNAAWASSALTQLEEAQAAMARGDWSSYGQSMSALKAFLESVAGGAAPMLEMPAMSGPGQAAASTMDERAQPAPQQADGAQASGAAASAGAVGAAGAAGTRAGMPRLVVIATGAELPLPQQEEITVGREDPSSGIFPDVDLTPYGGEDGGVSRRHARLLHVGEDYFVEDLQSTNYTKLDGQRLPARVRERLEDGARLDFGRVAVIFRKS